MAELVGSDGAGAPGAVAGGRSPAVSRRALADSRAQPQRIAADDPPLVVATPVELEPLPGLAATRAVLACIARVVGLLACGRIHQPAALVGVWARFGDNTAAKAYRETVIERKPPADPAVLVVTFRLRGVRSERAHALFRLESELNTLLFAGFPGLCSKLWFAHDDRGAYRGVYEWDGQGRAGDYARALSRMLAPVSEPGSIHYQVLPGLGRAQLLDDEHLGAHLPSSAGQWWCPVASWRDGR
ncbi:MAG: hypothetical protein M0004_13260 [Actinomycetota bacterium]|nr:hypothetical protein [Actinomycetota bacterium]